MSDHEYDDGIVGVMASWDWVTPVLIWIACHRGYEKVMVPRDYQVPISILLNESRIRSRYEMIIGSDYIFCVKKKEVSRVLRILKVLGLEVTL